MVNRYVKRPIPVEAIQYDGTNVVEIDRWMKGTFLKVTSSGARAVETLEGDMLVRKGDYIICGTEGEYYPCKRKIFEKCYEQLI